MGHIYVRAKISNMERTKSQDVEALADTGATLTVIPQKMAQELQLGEVTRETVESGAGQIELQRSSARIGINGKESVQDVLISDFIDRVLLGVVTLESLALSLDPLTGKLKQRRLLLYENSSLETSLRRGTVGRQTFAAVPLSDGGREVDFRQEGEIVIASLISSPSKGHSLST